MQPVLLLIDMEQSCLVPGSSMRNLEHICFCVPILSDVVFLQDDVIRGWAS